MVARTKGALHGAIHDKLSNGHSYKMLTVLDEFTRLSLAVTVGTRMGAEDVLKALYPPLLRNGTPEYIRSDNGPEFIAEALQDWLRRVGVTPIHIDPGSPSITGSGSSDTPVPDRRLSTPTWNNFYANLRTSGM